MRDASSRAARKLRSKEAVGAHVCEIVYGVMLAVGVFRGRGSDESEKDRERGRGRGRGEKDLPLVSARASALDHIPRILPFCDGCM